jgi:serine protease inhibitor
VPLQAEVQEVANADPINEWAARVTKGLITTAVPPGTAFDLVLTNAVYFKGRCSSISVECMSCQWCDK